MTSKKLFVFLALCILWGSTWFASSVLAGQIPAMKAAGIRFLLGAIILLPVILLRKLALPRGRVLSANLILSGTMIAFPIALATCAQARVSVGITAILFAFTPLIAGFFGDSTRGVPMPQSAKYASILGVAGTALLLSSAISNSLDQAAGIFAVLLAVVSGAISSVFAKREFARVHPIISASIQLFGAAILLFLLSVFFERNQSSAWTPASVIALVSLAVAASAVAYPLYFWLLKEMEPWQTGTLQWFQPLVAILEGALLFRESLSWRMIGGAAILLGCAMHVITAQTRDDDAVTLRITG